MNYQFGTGAAPSDKGATGADTDRVNIHAQSTFVEQAYPTFRSPYAGTNRLPGTGEGRETWDATLYTGVRLWQGAELWIDPEIDQGLRFGNTPGVARLPERGVLQARL